MNKSDEKMKWIEIPTEKKKESICYKEDIK
jgi:hypothetical protein